MAQTLSFPAQDNVSGHTVLAPVVISNTSSLIPVESGNPVFGRGDKFRLLFVTSNSRDATSTDISDYNDHVQARAAAVEGFQASSEQFRAVGSTDAGDNTATTGTSWPIYWVSGEKVAEGYSTFYGGDT